MIQEIKKRGLYFFLPLTLVVGWLMLATASAKALTLVPPSLEFATQPGQKIDTMVKVYNETTEAINVVASTAPFVAKDETGVPDFNFTDPVADLASWITLPAGPIGIQPGERVEIPVKVVIPSDAPPGGHYAGIFFETVPTEETPGQVKLKQKLGTLLILRIEGQIRELAAIASFTVKNGATVTRLPTTFDLRIQNSGNVHIRPQGKITIKNLFGGETETLSLNDTNGAVLPNSIRMFDASWKKTSDSDTRLGFFGELKQQWSNFAIGPYTATANLTYGTNGQSLVATAKVTVIPWQLLLVELLVLVIVILAVVYGVRAYNRAIIRRAENNLPKNKP